jgi:type VI protein secretion system component VasF
LLAFAAGEDSDQNERRALEAVYSPTSQGKPADSRRHPQRRRAVWAYAAGATLIAVAAVAGYLLWRHPPV